MKTYLVSLLICMTATTWAGGAKGNGGGIAICEMPGGGTYTELFDIVEMQILQSHLFNTAIKFNLRETDQTREKLLFEFWQSRGKKHAKLDAELSDKWSGPTYLKDSQFTLRKDWSNTINALEEIANKLKTQSRAEQKLGLFLENEINSNLMQSEQTKTSRIFLVPEKYKNSNRPLRELILARFPQSDKNTIGTLRIKKVFHTKFNDASDKFLKKYSNCAVSKAFTQIRANNKTYYFIPQNRWSELQEGNPDVLTRLLLHEFVYAYFLSNQDKLTYLRSSTIMQRSSDFIRSYIAYLSTNLFLADLISNTEKQLETLAFFPMSKGLRYMHESGNFLNQGNQRNTDYDEGHRVSSQEGFEHWFKQYPVN